MKIAVPTIGGILDEFFVYCEVFTVFTVDSERNIVGSEIICTPQGCDCKSNIPYMLQQKGVTVMLAGQLTHMAAEICKEYGITIYSGYSGDVNAITLDFLSNSK